MKVRMNTSVVSYSGVLYAGAEYILPQARAEELITARQAEAVEQPRRPRAARARKREQRD